MPKFTQLALRVENVAVMDGQGHCVADCLNDDLPPDVCVANAELFADAPALLAALIRVTNLAINCVPGAESGDEWAVEAVALIRKHMGQL